MCRPRTTPLGPERAQLSWMKGVENPCPARTAALKVSVNTPRSSPNRRGSTISTPGMAVGVTCMAL